MKSLSIRFRLLARALRAFFYLLYHPFAWTYDGVAALVSLGMWKDWVASVLPDLEGPRVLELGHGPGHLQAMMNEKNILAFGLDESSQMGKLARRRLAAKNMQPQFSRGYTQNIPFADQSFDQVVATFPSEYILAEETLAETWRVLAEGGRLVILPVAWITGQSWIERAAARLFQVTGQAEEWDHEMMAPFSKVGFQTEIRRINHKRWILLILIARKF